jgi:hypothetical protein
MRCSEAHVAAAAGHTAAARHAAETLVTHTIALDSDATATSNVVLVIVITVLQIQNGL